MYMLLIMEEWKRWRGREGERERERERETNNMASQEVNIPYYQP
jgi:hypothetical protein